MRSSVRRSWVNNLIRLKNRLRCSAVSEPDSSQITDPILVLGAKVRPQSATRNTSDWPYEIEDYRGKIPGTVLTERLEKAFELAQGNDVPVVVSGKGEAPAMAWWLFAHGLDPQRIIAEYDATSTNENLENAQALLPAATRWNVVTSDFHLLRTALWAHHLGLSVRLWPALTRIPYRQRAFLREIVAFTHSFVRVLWRSLLHRVQ